MKIKTLIISLLVFFLSHGAVFAQDQTIVKPGFGMICLTSTDNVNRGIKDKNTDLPYKLMGEKYPVNTAIYVIACLKTKCQAFVESQQSIIYGSAPFSQTIFKNISFNPSSGSTTLHPDNTFTTSDGNVNISGTAKIPMVQNTKYRFSPDFPQRDARMEMFGGYFITGNETEETQINTIAGNGSDTGLKNGVVEWFVDKVENIIPTVLNKKCVAIWWDPYGRVFDSQSLEPVADVQITLFDAQKQLVTSIPNPELSSVSGVYNFVVPEGIYSLGIDSIPSTHTFTAAPRLAFNYQAIYHKSVDKSTSIYQPDAEIREIIDTPEEVAKKRPNPEERDIPLDPGTNPPHVAPIVAIPEEDNVVFSAGASTFYGKASHPYPIVELMRKDNGVVVRTEETSDEVTGRYGFWKIVLPQSEVPTDTALVVVLKKNPKYLPFAPALVEAGTVTNVAFEPILRSVEGFAKDATGQVLANTEVSIRLKQSDTSYFVTKTDANGYYFVPSKNLPSFAYTLAYKPQNATELIRKSTSTFAKENVKVLSGAAVNLNTERSAGKKETLVSYARQYNDIRIAPTYAPEAKKGSMSTSSSAIIGLVVLLVALVGIGGGAAFMAMNKKNQTF